MKNKRVSCKGNAADIPACEYDSAWICKHPKCKSIVLTSTMYGARPSGCPKVDMWNRRVEDEQRNPFLKRKEKTMENGWKGIIFTT